MRFLTVWMLCSGMFIGGCYPDRELFGNVSAAPPEAKNESGDSTEAKEAVQKLCDAIISGDFQAASQTLADAKYRASGEDYLSRLKEITADYNQIQKKRAAGKQDAYKEQMESLRKLSQKAGADYTADANDISEILATVLSVNEYAEEDQKKLLFEDPFVKHIIDKSIKQAGEFESQGKWADAYAVCYYWLSALYKDNTEYKNKTEELTEKATIEMVLQDDSCGQTSAERHQGIKADMLLRALKALDFNYVSTVDYAEMTKNALKRCRLTAQVLMDSQKAAYNIDKEQTGKWNKGIKDIEKTIEGPGSGVSRERFSSIFDEVLALNTVTLKLPDEVVVAQFTEAAFKALDPYTNLIWPKQVEEFQKSMTQQFSGIGVEISKVTGALKVASLLPNTPAYTSGLDADDEITAVNGEPTKDMTIFCAVSKITGPKGTNVTLTIKRSGSDKTEDITIMRGEIVVAPLRGWQRDQSGNWKYMIDHDNRIGYVRLTAFTENSSPDIEQVLKKLESEGLRGLILDLRFNSGGYLTSAAEIVDMFIEEGLIVKSQPRWGMSTAEFAHKDGTHPNYPLVVLINEQSASASEIVAGALQDQKYKRATIVGARSYGKGSVQVVVPYTGGGSQLKYTMAYYHLPSEQPVRNRYETEKQGKTDWGIAPDVEVKLRANEFRSLIEIQRANDVLAKAGHDEVANPVKRHTLEETLDSDPQLAVSLMVLKAKMLRQGTNIEPGAVAAKGKTADPAAKK